MHKRTAQSISSSNKRACDVFGRTLRKHGLLSPRSQETLLYEMSELLESCASLPAELRQLSQALNRMRSGSVELWEASTGLAGYLDHMKYHCARAQSIVRKLSTAARKMPPLCDMTDDALGAMVLEKASAALDEVRGRAASKRGAKAAQRQDSPKGKRVVAERRTEKRNARRVPHNTTKKRRTR